MSLAYHQSSFAPLAPVNAVAACTSAKFDRPQKKSVEALRVEFREVCAGLLSEAFPSTSPHGTALDASEATGICKDKFYRILIDKTEAPDFAAVMAAIRCSSQQVSGCKAFGLLLAIMTSEGGK